MNWNVGEKGNESSASLKRRKIFEQLNDCWLSNKESAQWNLLHENRLHVLSYSTGADV
jgi:hypothetical protein